MENYKTPVAFLYDGAAKTALNAANQNAWDVYYEEILSGLGVTANKYTEAAPLIQDLHRYQVILCGEIALAPDALAALEAWVRGGGSLICFRTPGIGQWMDFTVGEDVPQSDGEFTVGGYLQPRDGALLPVDPTRPVLPVFSRIFHLRVNGPETEVLADMLDPVIGVLFFGQTPGRTPAILRRRLGGGAVCFYTFSLAQTMFILHQGRPVDRDWDGDGYYRTGDAVVLHPLYDTTLPCGDYHAYMLKSLIETRDIPSIHTLPPKDGEAADLLLFYGGDDEASTDGCQRRAALWMKERGLPYHINIMQRNEEGFSVSRELYDELTEWGTEPSIHFQFNWIRRFYTREDFNKQLDLYEKQFGATPVSSVNHCLMWSGWSEQARWAARRGMKGDNSRAPCNMLLNPNPINTFGMPFGTPFPHFVYDDAAHGNERLDFAYLPISYYEPRVSINTPKEDREKLHTALRRAADNGWTLNFFVHPIYIADYPECRAAILTALAYIEEQGLRAHHMGADAACLWWFDRAASRVETEAGSSRLRVTAAGERGIVVSVPDRGQNSVTIDGAAVKFQRKTVSGFACLLITVPAGEHEVEIE